MGTDCSDEGTGQGELKWEMTDNMEVIVKKVLGALVLVILLLTVVAACTSAPEVRVVVVTAPPPPVVPPQRVLDLAPPVFAADTFLQNVCGACHGPDLKGKIGPNLQDAATRLTAEELIAIIAGGRHGTSMPAWSSVLTPAQIVELGEELDDYGAS